MKTISIALAALLLGGASPVFAKGHHHHHHYRAKHHIRHQHRIHYDHHRSSTADYRRPRAWCGWWLRTKFGGGPEYNLARAWARRGSPTSLHVGAVVVWNHHVGYVSGQDGHGRWIVTSGNDGHRVRSRVRSLAGVIAVRQL